MGQNQSCLSSAENAEAFRRRHNLVHQPIQPSQPLTSSRPVPDHNKETSHVRMGFKPETSKTTTTDATSEDDLPDHDRNHGYTLVDLKGDRLLHTEPRTLQGCEIYAPGIGIGLVVGSVGRTKYNFHYKVQMADGRNVVIAVRRCEAVDATVASNLNPRIFVMQRLY